MTLKTWPPRPDAIAYWRLSWLDAEASNPVTIWYEVTPDGSVLRLIDIYRDVSTRHDTLDNYPDGASDVGFGTLIDADFYELDWPLEDTDLLMMPASELEFTSVWAAVA